jgi:hypothetical protein
MPASDSHRIHNRINNSMNRIEKVMQAGNRVSGGK